MQNANNVYIVRTFKPDAKYILYEWLFLFGWNGLHCVVLLHWLCKDNSPFVWFIMPQVLKIQCETKQPTKCHMFEMKQSAIIAVDPKISTESEFHFPLKCFRTYSSICWCISQCNWEFLLRLAVVQFNFHCFCSSSFAFFHFAYRKVSEALVLFSHSFVAQYYLFISRALRTNI